MKTTESQLKASKKYREKCKKNGLNQHIIWCSSLEWEILKIFYNQIKKIENLDSLSGLDVSDDGLNIKLIIDDKV